MAEDFETHAGIAANALEGNRQWANEHIREMVRLHQEALQSLQETQDLLQASGHREEAEKAAHALTRADRDTHKQHYESTLSDHVALEDKHREMVRHRDQLALQLEETNGKLRRFEKTSCFFKGFCSHDAIGRS